MVKRRDAKGSTRPPTVEPGVKAIIKAMRSVRNPPKFISMSSISVNDSLAQAKKSWGRALVWLMSTTPFKGVFEDLKAAEDYIRANRGELNIVVARATVLGGGEPPKVVVNFAEAADKTYKLVTVADEKAKLSFKVERQTVAQALLDLCTIDTYDNTEVSIFAADTKKYPAVR